MHRFSERRQPLFVYGTLLFPEILDALLGRVPDAEPASVPGWRVAALPGLAYPVLVPGSGAAPGRLLSGLSESERRIVDVYEDDWYDLRPLVLTDGRTGWAFTATASATVSPGDWDAGAFAAGHLAAYVEGCAALRAELLG
ncbi:gamma-glutamylcyclotransferase [Nocardiopsis sp. CNR-923]|uniref:gamma-glutamylcyclotransferase family protein n=1 Tax=Nocardiopsis sp. CNR-923 TaxID=1904965 RepID=UPI0009610C8D|nr:gamma-glutamylcyclotransferase family protein [Nocardiopsis sp. CNR-923]OLT26627.1 gamma-glutamylcyclotransferase [Nocardiopsis sp. CNR-923]